MTTALTLGFFSCFSLLHGAPASESGGDAFLGKWDMVIANSGSSFSACTFSLAPSAEGLAGEGEMVWRWGSVWRIEERAEVTLGEDGGLSLENKALWASPLELERVGDTLEGSVTEKDGTVFHVKAWPARNHVDLNGTWDMVAQLGEAETQRGTLVFASLGGGAWSATAHKSEDEVYTARKVEVSGRHVELVLAREGKAEEDAEPLTVTAEVRGDQLAGQILTADGALPVRGTRGRKWGAPVRLLAEKGLEGWRPRDRSRPFRWTCEGGMLRNGEHDVDIVSLPEFDDFTLSLQYRIAPGGNSGIYLRGRYEVQIIGSDRIDKHGNCAVYSRLEPKSNPFRTQQDGEDQWQTLEATLIDRYLTLKLNGQPIFENVRLEGITGGALNPFEHTPGPIMLQGDHGQVAFRNIVVYPAK